MQCALHPTEFSRVTSCSTAKEMWDRLQVIYKRTSEVRETKANMLVSEYEAFKMKSDETIFDMYSRLTVLTNGLKSLKNISKIVSSGFILKASYSETSMLAFVSLTSDVPS